MSLLGIAHVGAACIALASGSAALQLEKGSLLHRISGYLFALAMGVVNVAALCLYDIDGRFNLFHALAIINLIAVAWAMWPFVLRRPGFGWRHARRMPSAYIGLCAAAANELLVRVIFRLAPGTMRRFWILSIGVTLAVTTAGLLLARRQHARAARLGAPA